MMPEQPTKDKVSHLVSICYGFVEGADSYDVLTNFANEIESASYAKGVEEGKKQALQEVIRPISEYSGDHYFVGFYNGGWNWLSPMYSAYIPNQERVEYFANLPVPESVWGETI